MDCTQAATQYEQAVIDAEVNESSRAWARYQQERADYLSWQSAAQTEAEILLAQQRVAGADPERQDALRGVVRPLESGHHA